MDQCGTERKLSINIPTRAFSDFPAHHTPGFSYFALKKRPKLLKKPESHFSGSLDMPVTSILIESETIQTNLPMGALNISVTEGFLKTCSWGVWRVAFISLTLTNAKNITIDDINVKFGV